MKTFPGSCVGYCGLGEESPWDSSLILWDHAWTGYRSMICLVHAWSHNIKEEWDHTVPYPVKYYCYNIL